MCGGGVIGHVGGVEGNVMVLEATRRRGTEATWRCCKRRDGIGSDATWRCWRAFDGVGGDVAVTWRCGRLYSRAEGDLVVVSG